MLEKNLEAGQVGGDRKITGRRWQETLWTLTISLALIALFPVGLAAQTDSSNGLATVQVTPFGAGIQTPLQFAGESAPENQISLRLGASALYDDNVLARNSDRLSDEALSFTSHLGIVRQTKLLKFSFDYLPFFMLYRQVDQYDRLNHSANLGLNYQLSSRFILGAYDTFRYENGLLPSLSGQQILAGPTSPTALNQGIFAYTARTLSNMAGLDLTFAKSRRTVLIISGGYNQLKFGNQAGAVEKLYNGNGFSGGLQYQYLVTEHTNFGLLFLHQDSTYQGGELFGNRQRTQIESALLSVISHLTPTVTLTLHGGPQFLRTLGQSSADGTVANGLQASGGGSITKEVRATALTFAAQRAVSDGGGLYTSVVSSNVTLGVRRRLVGHWEGNLRGGGADVNTSLFHLGNEKTEALTGSIDITRPLGNGSAFHISYDTFHQLTKGTLPIGGNFDRNQVTIGIDFQLKAIPLGQ